MARSYEEQTRIDLAATFRIIAHLGMHEAVANHFSAAISADGIYPEPDGRVSLCTSFLSKLIKYRDRSKQCPQDEGASEHHD